MKLLNCRLTGNIFTKMHNDELRSLEGFLFPYAKFGGANLVLNPKETFNSLSFKEKKELVKILKSQKTYNSFGRTEYYIRESEVPVIKSIAKYELGGKVFALNFEQLHNIAEDFIEEALFWEKELAEVKENINLMVKDYIQNNQDNIQDNIKNPLDKLNFLRNIKTVLSQDNILDNRNIMENIVVRNFNQLIFG